MPSALHHRIGFTSRLIRKSKKKKNDNSKKKNKKRENDNAAAAQQEREEEEEEEEVGSFKLKPLDDAAADEDAAHFIQPLGNLLLLPDPAAAAAVRSLGLGALRALPDSLLLDALLPLLPACDLARLSAASKTLYVLATHDPLWRPLVLCRFSGNFSFSSSWRATYISSLHHLPPPPPAASRLRLPVFYSDHLFQSWLCARLEMKPEWLRRDNIERRRGISVDEFVSSLEEPNRPVLLQGCLDAWPAMAKWDRAALLRICGDARFAVGPVEMTLAAYFRYADAAREERPLYLFDPKFADKVPELGGDYEPPAYFKEDLFGLLGNERPDYRWIIVGPAGSGSSFHVDPNSTSAWNAVVRGSKKWVMFPPEVVPPGVHPSPDGAEVACPVSIMEWFMNFYGECSNWKRRPVECICRAGEVVFVPNGWWHLVINLEDSIAITQNYVSRRNLLNVLDFLKKPNASELVSGTEDRVNLYEKFRSALEAAFPGTIDELQLRAQEKMAKQKKLSFWESVSDANAGGFKFAV